MAAERWTLKGLIEKFIDVITAKISEVGNGSLHFVIHFRNGRPQKVEIETKEHFGSE
jgi:hypothetical protein